MTAHVIGLDHVQVAMPAGGEEEARSFYRDLLGFTEQPKPAALAPRGGCWFSSGSAMLHLGVETDFRPAQKAHPAFLVADLGALQRALTASGVPCQRADGELAGVLRLHCVDPFGNRLEFQQADAG